MNTQKMTVRHGYEMPVDVLKETKRAFRKLRNHGIVIVEHGDGPGLLVRTEVADIAEALGQCVIRDKYRIVVIDTMIAPILSL